MFYYFSELKILVGCPIQGSPLFWVRLSNSLNGFEDAGARYLVNVGPSS